MGKGLTKSTFSSLVFCRRRGVSLFSFVNSPECKWKNIVGPRESKKECGGPVVSKEIPIILWKLLRAVCQVGDFVNWQQKMSPVLAELNVEEARRINVGGPPRAVSVLRSEIFQPAYSIKNGPALQEIQLPLSKCINVIAFKKNRLLVQQCIYHCALLQPV